MERIETRSSSPDKEEKNKIWKEKIRLKLAVYPKKNSMMKNVGNFLMLLIARMQIMRNEL